MLQPLEVVEGNARAAGDAVVECVNAVGDGDCFGVGLFVDSEETSVEGLGFCAQTADFLAPQCVLGRAEDVAEDLEAELGR